MSELVWEKSSDCSDGACVEIAWHKSSTCGDSACAEMSAREDTVRIRNNQNPAIEAEFTRAQWRDFIAKIKAGEFSIDDAA